MSVKESKNNSKKQLTFGVILTVVVVGFTAGLVYILESAGLRH
jgi:cobalamin biosynthesis protein CobD/CbiB